MNAEAAEAEEKSSLVMGLVVPLVIVVALGAGAGWGLGTFVLSPNMPEPVAPDARSQAEGGQEGHGAAKPADAKGHEGAAPGPQMVTLDPIVTNIAVPSATWMRLELSLVLSGPLDPLVENYIHQDLLAFARTLRLDHVDTPTGYLQFRNDLLDRARLRAGPGTIEQVLIKTMLFE